MSLQLHTRFTVVGRYVVLTDATHAKQVYLIQAFKSSLRDYASVISLTSRVRDLERPQKSHRQSPPIIDRNGLP